MGRSVLFGVVFAAGLDALRRPDPQRDHRPGLAPLGVGQGTLLLVAYAARARHPRSSSSPSAPTPRQRLSWFARHEAAVSVVTGSMLVIVGFLMMTNLFMRLSQFFPTIPV